MNVSSTDLKTSKIDDIIRENAWTSGRPSCSELNANKQLENVPADCSSATIVVHNYGFL